MAEGLLASFFEHFQELQKRLLKIGITFFIFFAILVSFELKFADVNGLSIPYLYPNVFNAMAIQFFKWLYLNVAPSFAVAPPAVFNPTEGIMAEMKVALFLAVVLSMPMIVYQLGKFLAPALKPKEKGLLIKITLPATLLFISGAVFAYFFVLEFMFDFLMNMGVAMVSFPDPVTGELVHVAYMGIEEFINFTLMILLAFGLAFELPVIMVGLSAIGLVKPDFWKRNWRYSVVAMFIFGAVITPDGSGVTMILVAAPMIVLYVAGYFVSKRVVAKKKMDAEEPEKPKSS